MMRNSDSVDHSSSGIGEQMYEQKEIAFYSAAVAAWYATKFEKDKQLLNLSAIGIGLLVTLATAIGSDNILSAILYVIAVSCFLCCITTVLAIFDRNAVYLEAIAQDGNEKDPKLFKLDRISKWSFLLGVVSSLLIGIASEATHFFNMEALMAKESEKMINTSNTTSKKSLDGATAMRPAKPAGQPSGSTNQPGSSGSDKK
jgi:hypothetical protein